MPTCGTQGQWVSFLEMVSMAITFLYYDECCRFTHMESMPRGANDTCIARLQQQWASKKSINPISDRCQSRVGLMASWCCGSLLRGMPIDSLWARCTDRSDIIIYSRTSADYLKI